MAVAIARNPLSRLQHGDFRRGLAAIVLLACVPLAYAMGQGQFYPMLAALLVPLIMALFVPYAMPQPEVWSEHDRMPGEAQALEQLQELWALAQPRRAPLACLVLCADPGPSGQTANALSFPVLRSVLRRKDRLIRLDAQRLICLLQPGPNLNTAAIEAITQRLAELESSSGFSVGYAVSTAADIDSPEALLDAALLAAAQLLQEQVNPNQVYLGPTRGVRAYDLALEQAAQRQVQLRQDLPLAFARGEIFAHFQPQLCTDTGAVTGMEALARWQHPEFGLLQPADFLPLIDTPQLNRNLLQAILGAALQALQAWRRAGLVLPSVSVNFSAMDLRDPGLVGWIGATLAAHGFAPSNLTVEVLETVVKQGDEDQTVKVIADLAALGCGIDLDDFGTGHTSIASLHHFAIQRLKIDRALIGGIDQDPALQKLVAALVVLAERLDLAVLAEGVETPAEHAMLAQLGCSHVQGFAITPPLAIDAAASWLRAAQSKPEALPDMGLRWS